MNGFLLLFLIVLVGLALLALGVWVSSFFRKPPESGKRTIDVDGEERTYVIRWPARLDRDFPLLLCFHGGIGNAEKFLEQTQLFDSGTARNYVVVYPEAEGGWIDQRPERGGSRKDLDFIDKLLDHLLLQPEIDPKRIYATGVSNGGLFIFRIATEQPQRFAGFATALAQMPVAALDNLPPGPPIPILLAYGQRDFVMPFDGGEIFKGKQLGSGGTVISAEATLEFWVERNKAVPIPKSSYVGDAARLVEVHDFDAGPGGARVRYVEVQNWGHRWPKWEADPAEGIGAFDIADVFFEFFSELSKSRDARELQPEPPRIER